MSNESWPEMALKWCYGIGSGVVIICIGAWLSFVYQGISIASSTNNFQDSKIATLEECVRSIKDSLIRIEIKVDKTDNKIEKLYELRVR